MEPFKIILEFSGNQRYVLRGELIETSQLIETYMVKANNATFVFTCNRPELALNGAAFHKYTWMQIDGPKHRMLSEIIKQLEIYVRNYHYTIERNKIG